MEFEKVMRIKKRMCDINAKGCKPCILSIYLNKKGIGCNKYITKYPKEAEEIIIQWDKEHPIMTNADKLQEVFNLSNANINIIKTWCPFYELGNDKCVEDNHFNCEKCRKWWNEEYKGGK